MAKSEFEHLRKAGDDVHLTDSSTDAASGKARALPGEEGMGGTAGSGAETPCS